MIVEVKIIVELDEPKYVVEIGQHEEGDAFDESKRSQKNLAIINAVKKQLFDDQEAGPEGFQSNFLVDNDFGTQSYEIDHTHPYGKENA